MRLLEPLGLLDGEDARTAVAAGIALPLAGGAGAYALARLIEADMAETQAAPVVAAAALPDAWRNAADRLAAAPPPWAGLDRLAVMGIVNVTPDSFSDGGDALAPERAEVAGRAMVQAGADMLDIGGESTRPGNDPAARGRDGGSVVITPAEEQARILPVIRRLRGAGVPLSIDTRNAATMAAVLDEGAAVINDVSGLAHDPDALPLLARRDCAVALMHMRGTPQTMAGLATYRDVALEVTRELAARVEAAERAGIDRARIAVDPGIGFAKRGRQNIEVLRRLPLLLNLGCRILVGVSRKAFIGQLAMAAPPKQRGPGSLAAGLYAAGRGASILRVHDAAETAQAAQVWQALLGRDAKASPLAAPAPAAPPELPA